MFSLVYLKNEFLLFDKLLYFDETGDLEGWSSLFYFLSSSESYDVSEKFSEQEEDEEDEEPDDYDEEESPLLLS